MVEYGRVVPSLAFFHIPTYAPRTFQETGIQNHTKPGNIDEESVKYQGYFWDDEDYMDKIFPL